MTQPKTMNHQDFLDDPRLSLDQIGALALMVRSDGPFTGDWLFQTRPASTRGSVGRTRSQRIMRGLKDLGYADAKTIRIDGVTRICTSIRGSLGLPFSQSGPLIEAGHSPQLTAIAEPLKSKECSTEIAVHSDVIEAELVDDEVSIVTAKRTRKPTVAQQTKAIRQDPRWIALLEAYREMLRGISKLGNLGEVAQAAKEFAGLVGKLDEDPTLLTDILASLPRYQLACNGYPVRLKRYLEENMWKSYPPKAEMNWEDFKNE